MLAPAAGERGRAPCTRLWQGLTKSIIATNIIYFIHETFCLPLRRNYTLLNTKTSQLYKAMLKFYLTNNINIFG